MIIGIDPGKKGGVAVIYDPHGWTADPMPSDFELYELLAKLKEQADMNNQPIKCYVEQIYLMSKHSSNLQFAEHSGAIKQTLRIIGIPFECVTPSVWKKKLHLTKDKKASLILVRDLFGHEAGIIKNHDGMAEALLIAYYGKKYL